MATDRKNRRNEAFSNFEKGARADEFIFGDSGYTETDMLFTDNSINALLTGSTIPDPDSTAAPTTSITLDDNKLYPDVLVNDFTTEVGAGWAITRETTATPTVFTDGTYDRSESVADFNTGETWRFWQNDDVNGPVEALEVFTGVSGITVIPKDTLPPEFTANSFSITSGAVLPNSTIDCTLSTAAVDPTPGSGLASYNILNAVTNDVLISGATSLTNTVSLPPGTYTLLMQAVDVAGNISESNTSTTTISVASAGSVGWTNLTQTEAEDVGGGTFTVELTRVGTGAFDIDVSTYSSTAKDTTEFPAAGQYDLINSQTVSFGASDLTKDVTVTVTDQSSSFDNQFFLQIDYDTRPAEITITRETTEVILSASGTAGVIGWQQEDAGSTDDLVSFNLESANHTIVPAVKTGRVGETWNQYSDTGRSANELSMWGGVSPDWGTTTLIDVEGPYISALINFKSTGTHYLMLRGFFRTSTTGRRAHWSLLRPVTSIGADDSGGAGFQLVTLAGNHGLNATNSGAKMFFEDADVSGYNNVTGYDITSAAGSTFEIANTGLGAAAGGKTFGEETLMEADFPGSQVTAYRAWTSVDGSSNRLTMNIPVVGQYELRVYFHDYQYTVDKAVITTSIGYDADITDSGDSSSDWIDEAFGPVQSDYISTAGGSGGLNPDNLDYLPYAIPSVGLAPDILSPGAGAIDVSKSVTPFFIYNTATQLELNHIKIIPAAGDAIISTTATTTSSATVSPVNPLSENTTYTMDVEGRIVDSAGVTKAVDGSGWSFSTVNTANTIVSWDFAIYEEGHVITQQDVFDIFNKLVTNSGITSGLATVVSDPLGERGNVLRVQLIEGIFGSGTALNPSGISIVYDFSDVGVAPQNEVYVSYHAMVGPPGDSWVWTPGAHLAGIGAGDYEEVDGNNQATVSHQYYSSSAFPNVPDGAVACYAYHATDTQQANWWNDDDPTKWNEAGDPGQTVWTQGVWHEFVFRAKMNTFVGGVGQFDGELEAWKDGIQVLLRTNIQWGSTDSPNAPLWDGGSFKTYLGGGTTFWAPSQNQAMFFDDFRVYT